MVICSQRVFRCFRTFERLGDKITGYAGPWFVALANCLILCGLACFFDVIAPTMRYPLLSIPACLILIINMVGHYFWVVMIPPGFVDVQFEHKYKWFYARRKDSSRVVRHFQLTPAARNTCRKCGRSRPEKRAHHCRVCDICVLKYDHHCPVRINQCVGLYNERHFVMFMAYLVVCASSFCYLAWEPMSSTFGFANETPKAEFRSTFVPPTMLVMMFILSAVMAFCVLVMLLFQLHGVVCGETSVETQDFEVYRKNEEFVNSYDLGRQTNLHPLYTLFLPLLVMPYTDGYSIARRVGCEDGHKGVSPGDQITDDEGEYEV
ncbi:hypothetical protein FISHEDRAFT_64693 [Fistulina hepatica ATCC 64428]|uniref:Palmitoyltransferase n=1 Tax=Fistulina hepatica ATCC 64428 TaxID=1128425 RepID=A0A0D7AGC4_9AGAR|nr:hypothetical protein FISHEDRAFT_64693 [Fistulina hepatica ATCC 64428]